jgi:hypothetical protein
LQIRLPQRRHVNLPVNAIERLIPLQVAEEISTQAHQRTQALIGKTLGKHLRESAPLALLGAHVQLFALVDIDEKGRRLGLTLLLQSIFGRIQETPQCPVSIE